MHIFPHSTSHTRTIHNFPTPHLTKSVKASTTYTQVLSPTPTNSVTQLPTSPNNSLEQFSYPHATITQSSDTKASMTSSDDPTTITNWYKNVLTTMHMSTTAVSMSSTNNSVSNQLAGDNGSLQVRITITKNANSSHTTIDVTTTLSTQQVQITNETFY